jgi:hypothetical protein
VRRQRGALAPPSRHSCGTIALPPRTGTDAHGQARTDTD